MMLNHIPFPSRLAMPWLDRRSARRFSLRMTLTCRLIELRKMAESPQSPDTIVPGESLKISRKDLLFRSCHLFLPGQLVEVSIEWPMRPEHDVRLMLVVKGRVRRRFRDITAMQFERHQFTRAAAAHSSHA